MFENRYAGHLGAWEATQPVPEPITSEKAQPRAPLDQAAMDAMANAQSHSIFYRNTPREIRNAILKELWRDNWGIKRHVFYDVQQRRYRHAPCVTDHDAPDTRHNSATPAGASRRTGMRRRLFPECPNNVECSDEISAAWSNHWRCLSDMLQPGSASRGRSVFLPALLTCKRMYLEARQSIAAEVTFIYTSFPTFIGLKYFPLLEEARKVMLVVYPRPDEMTFKWPGDEKNVVHSLDAVTHRLSQMKHLQNFTLWLGYQGPMRPPQLADVALKSLLGTARAAQSSNAQFSIRLSALQDAYVVTRFEHDPNALKNTLCKVEAQPVMPGQLMPLTPAQMVAWLEAYFQTPDERANTTGSGRHAWDPCFYKMWLGQPDALGRIPASLAEKMTLDVPWDDTGRWGLLESGERFVPAFRVRFRGDARHEAEFPDGARRQHQGCAWGYFSSPNNAREMHKVE